MPEADVDQREVLYTVFKTPLQKNAHGARKKHEEDNLFLHPSITKYHIYCVKRMSC